MNGRPPEPQQPNPPPLEPEAIKRRVRALRWQPDAVMREMILVKKLRELLCNP
jgi:hypothetical protein